ncbi:hypothetical protein OROHE_019827 [Orobanche hederae]
MYPVLHPSIGGFRCWILLDTAGALDKSWKEVFSGRVKPLDDWR